MADRRDLRQRVIALIENDFSASAAGRSCHIPLKTAQRWAHKCQNYGECQRRYSTGRPRCSTRKGDEAVRWVDEENSFRSANQIWAAANFPSSFRTAMNRLRDANIHCWRATHIRVLVQFSWPKVEFSELHSGKQKQVSRKAR